MTHRYSGEILQFPVPSIHTQPRSASCVTCQGTRIMRSCGSFTNPTYEIVAFTNPSLPYIFRSRLHQIDDVMLCTARVMVRFYANVRFRFKHLSYAFFLRWRIHFARCVRRLSEIGVQWFMPDSSPSQFWSLHQICKTSRSACTRYAHLSLACWLMSQNDNVCRYAREISMGGPPREETSHRFAIVCFAKICP